MISIDGILFVYQSNKRSVKKIQINKNCHPNYLRWTRSPKHIIFMDVALLIIDKHLNLFSVDYVWRPEHFFNCWSSLLHSKSFNCVSLPKISCWDEIECGDKFKFLVIPPLVRSRFCFSLFYFQYWIFNFWKPIV